MASASPYKESPDLLRTTLLFNLGTFHIENLLKKDEEERVFSFFDEVKAGRITEIDQEIQRLQKFMNFDQITEYVNQRDEEQKTPLFYACYYNYQNIILYLLMKGADPFIVDSEGRNCIYILAFKGLTESINLVKNFYRHIIRRDCLNKIKEAKKTYTFLKSDIHKGELVSPDQNLKSVKAKFREFLPKIKRIFKDGYLDQLYHIQERMIAQLDEHNRTPVHYSAMSKYTRCNLATKLLLINEFDKVEGYNEFEALWDELQLLELTAEKREETKSALQTLELIENILSKDTFNTLVKDFKRKVSQLQRKVINSQDNDGYTPMHLASFYGDFLCVQFLLTLGGDEHIKDHRDNKPVIDYAANKQVRRVLLDLKEAAKRGDVESFDSLLNSEDKNKIDERTTVFTIAPIHNAVHQANETKNQDMLNLIIRCGANLNVNDSSGWTPLHHACQNGDLETVKNLVENEAYINVFSNKHFFPIHIAALHNHPHIIEYLFENGADLECQSDEECTPLHLASKKGHVESMKTLLELGANIYALDMRKWNALHYSSYNGHPKAVNLLCRYDADFEKLREMKNSQGKVPKEIASLESVKFQFNTIWKAAYDGNLDILRRLHRFGEDINGQTPIYQLTPLIIATQRHHILVVKYLLDNGANRELPDVQGRNAYEYSVMALNLIKIDKRAQIKVIDETKATPNEYNITRTGKKQYLPDIVAKIEKTYKLFICESIRKTEMSICS